MDGDEVTASEKKKNLEVDDVSLLKWFCSSGKIWARLVWWANGKIIGVEL